MSSKICINVPEKCPNSRAQALGYLAAGLAIAAPSVFAHSWLTAKAEALASSVDNSSEYFLAKILDSDQRATSPLDSQSCPPVTSGRERQPQA
jgi:hypothetical protein